MALTKLLPLLEMEFVRLLLSVKHVLNVWEFLSLEPASHSTGGKIMMLGAVVKHCFNTAFKLLKYKLLNLNMQTILICCRFTSS